MFIFPFARSYPAYKWPVGEYILPPRLLCVYERACTIPPQLPLDWIPVIRITRERDERKKRKPKKNHPFPHASTMRPRYPLTGLSVLHGSRVRTGVSYFIQRGTYPFRQEGKRKATGSRWIQSLMEKGGNVFLFFFVLSFPYGINGINAGWEPRYKGQRILLSCSLFLFGFFRVGGSRPSPWGTRGTRGMNDSEYLFGVSVSHTCVSVSIYK